MGKLPRVPYLTPHPPAPKPSVLLRSLLGILLKTLFSEASDPIIPQLLCDYALRPEVKGSWRDWVSPGPSVPQFVSMPQGAHVKDVLPPRAMSDSDPCGAVFL